MTVHRATCEDCPWSFEDGDLLEVSNEAEEHERKEMHDVDLQKAVATDGSGHVLVSRYSQAGVYHYPDPEDPTAPQCDRSEVTDRKWIRRDPDALAADASLCKYCDPGEHVAPKNPNGGNTAATLRQEFNDIDEDGTLVPDGGQEVDGLSLAEDARIAEFIELAEENATTPGVLDEPGDANLTLVELSASYLDTNNWLRTFSVGAEGFDSDDYDNAVDADTVSVSRETAREALREVEAAIDRTGGPDTGAAEANTPLAQLREDVSEADIDAKARGFVLQAIDEIAEERGIDVSGADPLVDATFQAAQELREALDAGEDDEQVATDGGHIPAASPSRETFATDDGPHKCDLCGQVFDELADLDNHECREPDDALVEGGGGRDA